MTRSLHIIFADGRPVVATPCNRSFGYCKAALELEGRHKIECRSDPLVQNHLPNFASKDGESCVVFVSLFNVVEQMRELLSILENSLAHRS